MASTHAECFCTALLATYVLSYTTVLGGEEVGGSVLSQAVDTDLPFTPVSNNTTHALNQSIFIHLFRSTVDAGHTRRSYCKCCTVPKHTA